jgi:hypothetical protein
VNSWLIAIKIFIENTKGVWYNIDNWGRPPKRGCGDPHATEQPVLSGFILSGVEVVEGQFHESDSFGHKKPQNDRIIGYFSIFLYVLYLIRNS